MNIDKQRITVTQPSLPPLDEFIPYLQDIWETKQLTNMGRYHIEFEQALCNYLGVKYISLFSNGTMALITALQALGITGEVITTPYSFVATTHALRWNNIKPVFVDIEPGTFTLDPEKIESAITPQTTAILPVHVYGNPCMVDKISEIARNHGIKVIYDACHTFGVTLGNIPLLNFGDLSVMSFHATKVFTTFEGGAIVCHDKETKKRIDLLKNLGFAGETTVVAAGINAKMTEFQAAFGLLQLKYIDLAIEKRKKIAEFYRENLLTIPGLTLPVYLSGVKHCYSYFPVLVDAGKFGMARDALYGHLKQHNIFCRRYFYPLINQFPAYCSLESAQPGKMPVAERVSARVICLPLYPALPLEDVKEIIKILKSCGS